MSAREDGPFLRGGQPINEGAQAEWHLKRVHSKTGPLDGTLMAEATRMPHDVPDQTTVLWKSDDSKGSNNIFAKSKTDVYPKKISLKLYIPLWDVSHKLIRIYACL